jgi:hypothetical protein
MSQTQTIMDTSVLDEIVQWIKALKDVGVSPDTAANVTTKFFIATSAMAEEGYEDDEDEDYSDYDEE